MNAFWIQITFIFLALVSPYIQAIDSPQTVAIVGGTVVDLSGKSHIENAVVLVKGERITAVDSAANVEIPAEAKQVDARGKWLIPGLMNMHVHLGLVLPGKMKAELANETEAA
ncbi:MAG: amidohydrolase family protein, partial [Gammaproteobacteria bacterium]|nr:amidohydrolase family protein [Gammaproteobacteria bacterium]